MRDTERRSIIKVTEALSVLEGVKMDIIPAMYDDCAKNMFAREQVRRYFISAVTEIPVEEIKRVYLTDPHLRGFFKRMKKGILDILVELENGTKINIEIQHKRMADWEKRQLYYLSRVYSQDLFAGVNYQRLQKSILISIDDFNITEGEEYHHVYRFRDINGREFSDLMEIHTIELHKKLLNKPIDEWIQVFNAKTEEELDMIRSDNPGIREAIQTIKEYGLRRVARAHYESWLKAKRDQYAMDEYIRTTAREEAMKKGRSEGLEIGRSEGLEIGRSEGLMIGKEEGIKALVEACKELGVSKEIAQSKLESKYTLPKESAEEAIAKYWK